MSTTPKTITEYLGLLRAALHDADPALVQDALYDAEEYLRAELAEHPDVDEASMLASIASSYGAPEEVADIYRVQETTVTQALRSPPLPERKSMLGRFFGVAADPQTYGALFYMLLSLPLGIFYFTWAVTGISLSAGLIVLIIGIPFLVLFMGTVYALSLVEGRIVETLLGVRMPRRPQYTEQGRTFLERVKGIFVEPRTWSTLLYMVLKLPLGVAYFTVAVAMISISMGLVAGASVQVLHDVGLVRLDGFQSDFPTPLAPVVALAGVVILFSTLHLARAVGYMHGQLAKHMLVKSN